MKTITEHAYPKINLALDILKKEGEFHLLHTVYYELRGGLFDTLTFHERRDGRLIFHCDNPAVPLGPESPVMRAARAIAHHAKHGSGAEIFISKKIPMQAGLGGGSSDVAAVLRGLARLWSVNLPRQKLSSIVGKISKDAAFFLYGGVAVGEHFGEKITPLQKFPADISIDIIDTDVCVPTSVAYKNIDLGECGKNIKKTDALIHAIRQKDNKTILENLHNDFEYSVYRDYPELARRAKELNDQQSGSRVLLCGSGGALVVLSINSSACLPAGLVLIPHTSASP